MNIQKYYFYKFFQELMPIYPIYVILFESKGLSIFQISLLLAIWSIPVIILEIPSGVLADCWSRKNLLVLGAILKIGCFFIWYLAEGFLLYAFGFLLWGVSSSFSSGAEEAFLYDSLHSKNKQDEFAKVLGKGRFLSGISMAIASFCGGYISMWLSINATLIISICMGVISVGVACSFREVNLYTVNHRNEDQPIRSMFVESFRFLLRKLHLFLIVLIVILVVGTSEVLDEYDQLIAKGFGLSIGAVGVWGSIRGILSAIGSLIAHYMKKIVNKFFCLQKGFFIIAWISVVGIIFLGISGYIQRLWAMIFYALYYLIMSSCQVIAEDYLQQEIEHEGRATVHSIISLMLNLFGTIFFFILGVVFSVSDLFTGIIITSVYMIIVGIVLCIVYCLLVDKKIETKQK